MPESVVTPFARWGKSRQRGDSDFTGFRGSSPVNGTTEVALDTVERSIGLRLRTSEQIDVFGEVGRHKWKLNSDASGTVGSLRARTQIQAQNTDPFFNVGLSIRLQNWQGKLTAGRYKLSADNEVSSRSYSADLMYAF